MSDGIETWRANGKGQLLPTGAGGVFVELYTFSGTEPNVTTRRTYTNLPGLSIFCVLVSGGLHNWAQGIDGNGYPYLESPGYAIPAGVVLTSNQLNTVIGVFAR